MQKRFYTDNKVTKVGVGIMIPWFLVISAGIIARGFYLKLVSFIAIGAGALTLFYLTLSRGVYITIEGSSLTVTRFFLRGKTTSLSDVVSIHKKPIYGGLLSEVFMKVRNNDGTVRIQGLINDPGLKESDLKQLLEMIHSVNPTIEIDQDLLRK